MSPGQPCNDKQNYTVTYEMQSVKQDDFLFEILNKQEIDITNCAITIRVRTTEAYPKINYYIVSSFINENKSYLGAIVITIGLFLVFLGAKFLKITILIVNTLSCITVLFLVYFNIFSPESESTVWILLAVGVVLGLAFGYFMIKLAKGITMLLGGYLGYLVSIFAYNLALQYIHASPHLIYWCVTIGCIFIFALLSLWIAEVMLIVSTSVIGSYAIVRGASFYIGSFPSESIILDLIKNKEWDELDKVKYFNIVSVCMGLCLFVNLG
jgi:hypothetical protein